MFCFHFCGRVGGIFQIFVSTVSETVTTVPQPSTKTGTEEKDEKDTLDQERSEAELFEGKMQLLRDMGFNDVASRSVPLFLREELKTCVLFFGMFYS
eukprot:symbB.v1.2.021513.t1/scaffold1858.1/size98333/6